MARKMPTCLARVTGNPLDDNRRELDPMRRPVMIRGAALAWFFAALTFLVFPTGTRPNRPTLALGGHRLGEKLSNFKARLPSAVCHRASDGAAADKSGKTSDVSENSGVVGCCVDDPAQVSALSSFKILFVGKCSVSARFNQERLTKLRYVVDASSIDLLLPTLTKVYGPVTQDSVNEDNVSDSLSIDRIAGWSDGNEVLNLTLTTLRGDILNRDPSLSKGRHEVKFIIMCLYNQKMEAMK
jgi:hypothetical protein